MSPKDINISEYNYELPLNRIAQFPLIQRDKSKLLIYKNGEINETIFGNIPDYLQKGCSLVFNDTKVIQARMLFQKESGSTIEIFCLEPFFPFTEIEKSFSASSGCIWKCFIGNAKKWNGKFLSKNINTDNNQTLNLSVEIKGAEKNAYLIQFNWDNISLNFGDIINIFGNTPLPPYIKRVPDNIDKNRYQTVYAQYEGSVAAPTAGLHFTNEVIAKINKNNINSFYVTLHVGAGTFKPVSSPTISTHIMHSEHFSVNKTTINNLLKNLNNNIIAVGTTSVRTLESIYQLGKKIILNKDISLHMISQWEAYENLDKDISASASLNAILDYMDKNSLDNLTGQTEILIVPGYKFKIVKGLITNFHQPQSTLLLLIAAFIGSDWKRIYNYALSNDFRFLSYGDSCYISRD
ncbi:MAG: S-adenosylmethionine:tRNA ribosyltransferase-isomerase [Bacteroidota bacterium]|nr:S-adenosylmethionine:tRNA ribosyltransferase-isomerase [Bacteroidota bacterium]